MAVAEALLTWKFGVKKANLARFDYRTNINEGSGRTQAILWSKNVVILRKPRRVLSFPTPVVCQTPIARWFLLPQHATLVPPPSPLGLPLCTLPPSPFCAEELE